MSEDVEWVPLVLMLLMIGSMLGIPMVVLWWDGRKARRDAETPPADE